MAATATTATVRSTNFNVDLENSTGAVEEAQTYPTAPWRMEEAPSSAASTIARSLQNKASSATSSSTAAPAIITIEGANVLEIDGCLMVGDNKIIPVENFVEAMVNNQADKISAFQKGKTADSALGDESITDESATSTLARSQQAHSAETTSTLTSSQSVLSAGPLENTAASSTPPIEDVVDKQAKNSEERNSIWTAAEEQLAIADAAKRTEIEMETPEILAAEKKV